MSRKQVLLRGTFILTTSGILSRIMGFFYRIFLSRTFGAENVGLYQLILPVLTLCFSISTAGIETAVSRTVGSRSSTFADSTQWQKKKESINILFSGILCSLIFSFLCIFIIIQNSNFIADTILGDKRCEFLLKLIVFTLPFSAIHNCIAGFYYGQKFAKIPALCQLLEQTARISTVFLLYFIYTQNNLTFSLSAAVIGLIAGESVSTIFSLYSLKKHVTAFQFHFSDLFSVRCVKELISLSFPLTLNRILINLLQGIEAVSIPAQLQKYNLTSSEALSIYGILNGMALPCILFPSAITTSAASLLMPTIAEIQATENRSKIAGITKKSCSLCFLLGLFCCFLFLISGQWIGNTLFHEKTAGDFILTLAWICPFLYTNTALQSIINGLGKTKLTLFINMLGLSVRILSVYFIIPLFGIKGYLWGLLASQFIICTTSIFIICIFHQKSSTL